MTGKEIRKGSKRLSGVECLSRDVGPRLRVSQRHFFSPMPNRVMGI